MDFCENLINPRDSVACTSTFSSNNMSCCFLYDFYQCVTLSHIIVEKFGPLFFTKLLQFTDHSVVHSSLKVLPQLYHQIEVWTLSCRFPAVLGITVLLHDPSLKCQTDGFMHTLLSGRKVPRSCGCETNPNQ